MHCLSITDMVSTFKSLKLSSFTCTALNYRDGQCIQTPPTFLIHTHCPQLQRRSLHSNPSNFPHSHPLPSVTEMVSAFKPLQLSSFTCTALNYRSSTHLSFAVVQNVIALLFGGIHDGLVAHTDGVDALDLDVWQASEHLDGVDHVCDLL